MSQYYKASVMNLREERIIQIVCSVLIRLLFADIWPIFNTAAIIPHYIMSQFRKTSVQCVT
jgi:hypothetical protein